MKLLSVCVGVLFEEKKNEAVGKIKRMLQKRSRRKQERQRDWSMHRGRERKELRSQMKDAWNREDKQKKDKYEGFAREGFGIKAATSKQMDEPGIKPNNKKCICLQNLRFEVLYLIN